MNRSANPYKRHRFPPAIIQHAVWLYHRFNLSRRDIEDLLAELGIDASYESVRLWCNRFGPLFSKRIKRRHAGFGDTFFIDEVFVTIAGRRHYLWRAVNQDGDVVDVYLQARRNAEAAKRLFRRLLRSHGASPWKIVTDKLGSYGVARRTLMPETIHSNDRYANNRAELSHQPTRARERGMRRSSTRIVHSHRELLPSLQNFGGLTMPAVFVHGVPDTPRVWRPVIGSLARKDIVTLALPGFNCASPEGFDATKEAYAAWIATQLEGIGEPVDLVAHDWGAILGLRVVSVRPDLIRTWACGGGVIDRDYVWHDLARQWQTPEIGEKVMDEVMVPDTVIGILVQSGVPRDIAVEVAASADERMKSSMLRLYRSATNLGAEWHEGVDGITRPGLVLWGRDDPFAQVRFAERLARRVSAELLIFDDCGHWWPSQRQVEAAQALERFWAAQT